MAEINGYKYPLLSPDEAEDIIDVLINDYGGEVSSEEAFAQNIGHSTANSGAYRGKLADLRKFGLLKSRGIEPTDLAFELANPKDVADEYQTKYEMLNNVQILSDLHENLGGQSPPNELWRVVQEITGANPKDAREASDEIEELYNAMLRYEERRGRQYDESVDQVTVPNQRMLEGEPQTSNEEKRSGILVRVDNDEMKFESVTDSNLKLARSFLNDRMDEADSNDEDQVMDENNAERGDGENGVQDQLPHTKRREQD